MSSKLSYSYIEVQFFLERSITGIANSFYIMGHMQHTLILSGPDYKSLKLHDKYVKLDKKLVQTIKF